MTESTVGRVVPAPGAPTAPPNGGSAASRPPALSATLVELHLGPAIDPANFPVSLQKVKDAFQFDERWQRILDANERYGDVNARLKTLRTEADRLKKAIDERENEIRIDPTYTEQIAGKNEAERSAKLAKVLKGDDAHKALSAELLKTRDELDALAAESEKLQSSMKLYLSASEEIGKLMQFAAMAVAAPEAAAAYLA